MEIILKEMEGSLFNNIVVVWMSIALMIFFVNLKIKAPYGRHTKNSWGPMIDNRLGWVLMELPALVICPMLYWLGPNEKEIAGIIIILLWIVHYFNRTLVFPLRIRTRGKKMPLVIMLSAVFFNLINGGICGYYLGWISAYTLDWIYSLPFISGIFIFLFGFFLNIHSDNILIHLRKPGETNYKIPTGGFFKWISCPNLFGEIIEWFGFAILCWALPCLSFFIWTFCNLVPRALAHHKWYHGKFENYPMERKAVFPFLL